MAEKPSAQFTKHTSTASTSNGHPCHQGSSSLLLLMSPAFTHEPLPGASSSLVGHPALMGSEVLPAPVASPALISCDTYFQD